MYPRPKLVFLMVLAVLFASFGAGPAAAQSDAVLTVTPQGAVPNETVVLRGAGFTPASTSGGAQESGAHQITGAGTSVITVGGTQLTSPNVTYPINFDATGGWATYITIPVTDRVIAGGVVLISAVDDQGLSVTTQITIRTPNITLDPKEGVRGSSFSLTGDGFPASNQAVATTVRVAITYGDVKVGEVTPDTRGQISTTLKVPNSAGIPSENKVRATVVGFDQFGIYTHAVPGALVTLSPMEGLPGSVVTVTGERFPAYTDVSSLRAGNTTVSGSSEPATDGNGRFQSFFAVPVFAPGIHTVSATVGKVTAVRSFTVLEGPVVQQPLPTPQPAVGASLDLIDLVQNDNLVRVWAYDNDTQNWNFFDPRPAFASINTVKSMVPGNIYWLLVDRPQSALLNGRLVPLSGGWNLVTW
ncbi:MAG: hypothetical protein O3A93_04675 [Chloroflexi bacterium]|nr:hypothetical protein [Chloroflexota bacterium]MDA1270537.1 hypothetical protein [Chloroflexota bacterium]